MRSRSARRSKSSPPDRKLKKRDHTYHPSFVPKQAKLEEEERKKQEEKAKQEVHKQEQERRKEEERVKKENERMRKEGEKMRKEEEKRMKEEEKRHKAEDDKRRKDEEKMAKEEEKRLKEDEKRKKEEEKKKQKEEKKKASTQKTAPVEPEPAAPAEEETIDLASHLDHYSVSVQPRSTSAPGRPRSSGTPRGSQGALNRQTLPGVPKPMYGSQQSLDRGSGMQSKMLQRYAKRSGSQDFTHHDGMQQFVKDVHRSQGSLEQRAPRSSLLQRYTPKPLSASSATAGQAAVPPSTPRSTSQVSLDKNRIEKSSLLQRYKPKEESVEADQRMGAVVFAPKKPVKHATFDYRDHEYEPIGEPVDSKPSGASSLAPPTDAQQRKLSSASLRVPGDDADTLSMNELQKDIEDRYFNRAAEEETLEETTAEPSADATQEKTSKMKAVMSRAQESGKKAMARAQESSKNAMSKAQEGGKSLQQKLRKQTDKFKTKMSNINIKKDKDGAPLASPEVVTTPELEKFDFTLAEPKPDQEEDIQPEVTVTVEDTNEIEQEEAAAEAGASKKKFKTPEFSKIKNIHMPKLQKPEFKRPEFTKITKPKMPTMSKFKRPEMPKFLTEKPDFSKLKMPEKIGTIKLQRSKSMKEPSDVASAASPSDVSVVGDDAAKKKVNYTDFSTFPRLLDKFKRQKSAPGNASVRASTPPPLEFTKAGKTTRPKGKTFISRWAEKSSEGAGSTSLFFTGSELGERESSVEKRMRQRLDRADFDTPELPITAEQKQLEEYDKENREIHLVSAARHDEFMKRKPPMERQESDLASEEEKQFWASSLGQKIRQNIDMNSNDFDFLDEDERLRVARENEAMGLSARDRARFLGEPIEQAEDYELRSTTPYSNKECQSSTGSSGIRRRKGVLEEIDDDEFFLRQKGISKDNIQMGEYISSAIKEGLGTPVNALAEMGRYDSYDQDMDASERMSMEYRGEMSFNDEFRRNVDMFKTFPPDRPNRKHKKSYNEEQYEDDGQKVPYDSYQQEEEDLEFYGRDRKYASEEPRQLAAEDERYMDEESLGNGFSRTGAAVPPTPPRRRKKRFRDVTPSELEPFANGLTSKPIYNSYTLGPETHLFNAEVPLAREESFTTPLPTPRRSRSRSQISKAFDDDRTSRGAESYIFGAVDSAMVKRSMDLSESNGYATVRKDPPPRPPAPIRRRRSTHSLGDQRQFNTLPNFHSVSPQRPSRNYSTINPNRPPRMKSNTNLDQESMRSASVSKNDFTEYEDIEQLEEQARMHQSLDTGAVVSKMKDRPLPPPPRPPRDHKKPKPKPDHDDRHDFDGGAEKIVATKPFERVEEVEIAIQTDPLPEDYELDIEVEETLGYAEEEAPAKTLREILKEEQQAEQARARQLAEATSLMRDIQKFRDSTSSLSQHGSRPETPAAAASILERRVSVPTASSMRNDVRPLSNENLSEQDLAHAEDDKYIAELVKKYVSEEKVAPTESAKRQQRAAPASQEIDAEKLREIEAMIVNERVEREEFRVVQSEPAAPPRRRSLVASSQDLSRSVEISPNVIEEIVERLRTNEQQHIAELQQLQQQQMEEMKRQQEEQQRLHDQKLEEQQKQLMEQQNQQLQETQQLKEQIQQQQEQQKELLLQLQQQEKEREYAREQAQQRAKELEQQRMLELQHQQLILQQQEKEREHARELEQQLAKELEQQRIRETQRIHELEMQRAREAELLRAKEAELLRAKEAELLRAKEAEMLRAMEAEMLRAREADLLRAREVELLKAKPVEPKEEGEAAPPAESTTVTVSEAQEPSNAASEEAKEAQPPARPPPPRISPQPPMTPTQQFPYQEYMPYSLSPQPTPFFSGRNYSDDEGAGLPQAPHRRRRQHRSRRESTSEEEFQRDQRKQRHGTRSPEPTIPALGGQLIRACGNSIRETGDELMTILRASSKDENKRDLHIALIILIVIVAGLMALGMSAERDVHHHHWDYFNPPGNGRA
ncbi:trichohyalin isoform X6 [Culex quinquefasciatus]|uniref:trichohyalin isoform X6 n=1 Tax=Culex quinquefasciatus TaxID=7176 RepID=UPI0018E36CDC|nr:trichohyalin isoform X6 [Culex quinquefasciatus]